MTTKTEIRAQIIDMVTDVYDRQAQIDETADEIIDILSHSAAVEANCKSQGRPTLTECGLCHNMRTLDPHETPAEPVVNQLLTTEDGNLLSDAYLSGRYAARVDSERIRNAAAILDTLTSNLDAKNPLRAEATEGAKRAVADLYWIADQIDDARAVSGHEGQP